MAMTVTSGARRAMMSATASSEAVSVSMIMTWGMATSLPQS